MKSEIAKGQQFGKWRLKKCLGEGGNGFVWLAVNSFNEAAAIKILAKLDGKSSRKTYARFVSEVRVVQENNDIEGLLPIIDYFLPDEITDEYPWYVMPVAQSLDEFLKGKDFEAGIEVILGIGQVLVQLHERDICHRDIKPANILVWDERFCLCDFGLVDYPDKLDLTVTGERIGARWTIAPEMERDSNNADGKPADVYSLAKTLWILLTGCKDGFEGQYDPRSINALKRRLIRRDEEIYFEGALIDLKPIVYTKPLDDLLMASTDHDPLSRPSMKEFVEKLESWKVPDPGPLWWQDVQERLFPIVLPKRAIWEDISDIVTILKSISFINGLNHMFFPEGGGLDLLGAELGKEPGTIELIHDIHSSSVVKPKRLIFESFNFDWKWEWNYFRLETGILESTGLTYVMNNYEALVEIAPLKYISLEEWECDYDDVEERDRKYPTNAKHICRFINGDFLIVAKSSTYNYITSTYDGRHNQMGTDEFRDYMNEKADLVQRLLQDEDAKGLAIKKDITIGAVIRSYLNKIFTEE